MKNEFHRVRTHHWKNGVLTFLDHFFQSFEEAMSFAISYECDSFKIFDSEDKLKYSSAGKAGNEYC